MDVNMEFRRAVTSTAFNISLSKAQVEILCAFAQGFELTEHSTFITTINALTRKGMVASRPYCAIFPGAIRGAVTSLHYERYVTDAGELMVKLISEAGLYVKFRQQSSHFIDSAFNVGVQV